jgi:outer membrane biosynthesis protein TonB
MNADQSRLTWALVLSVLLHGLLLSLLPFVRRAQLSIPQLPPTIDVDLASLPKVLPKAAPAPAAPAPAAPAAPAIAIPKQQIVTPPDAGEEKEPANTRFLSDRNNTVKEETVHRGEPPAGNPEAKQRPAETKQKVEAKRPQHEARAEVARGPAAESAGARPQVAALPKLDQLLPSSEDLIREGAVRPDEPEPAKPAPEQQASVERKDLLRHGDPWRTGGLRGGTMDFLPTVREGDITLLNTKADLFAPFVRRVAARVFEHLQIALRQAAQRASGGSGREYAQVEAVMSKAGQLVNARIVDRGSNSTLGADRELLGVTKPDIFFDSNPPSGAEAADGNIHFVLLIDLMVQADPRSARGGVYYNGVAGVGLK